MGEDIDIITYSFNSCLYFNHPLPKTKHKITCILHPEDQLLMFLEHSLNRLHIGGVKVVCSGFCCNTKAEMWLGFIWPLHLTMFPPSHSTALRKINRTFSGGRFCIFEVNQARMVQNKISPVPSSTKSICVFRSYIYYYDTVSSYNMQNIIYNN